jgi:hypothetical protein
MKAPSVKTVRCAIYTRVSTEHGLDQEFNSLDALSVRSEFAPNTATGNGISGCRDRQPKTVMKTAEHLQRQKSGN